MYSDFNLTTAERTVVTYSKLVLILSSQELRELESEDEKHVLKESLGSSRLGRKVDLMINRIEHRLRLLETEIDGQPSEHRLDADG